MSETIRFKHARFSTRLPVDCRYSPSHYWLGPDPGEEGVWRVGFTKFATRILGELVECDFDVNEGDRVESGTVIGFVEGFKALSDLYCVADGEFRGGNPVLRRDACIIRTDPYRTGWLYRVKGEPEVASVDVHGYVDLLNATIEKMMAEGH